MPTPSLGWRKDQYDKRDWLHKTKPLAALPERILLDEYIYDVRNQGNVSSCVGFSFAGVLNTWAKKLKVYKEWFSPTWIYNGARYIEGTLLFDVGCYPRNAAKWLKDKGGLLERYWPYDPYKLDTTAPPSRLEKYAKQYPIISYYRCVDGVDGLCSAISDGFCVSIGTPWFEKWFYPGPDGRLPDVNITDSIAGGHATVLYGYDRVQGYFYGINSWGVEWGNQGKFMMPFSAIDLFKRFGGYDAYYILVDWKDIPPEPEPEPEPEPTPQPEPKKFGIRLQVTYDSGKTWKTIIEKIF